MDLVYEEPGHLDPEFCNDIIWKFDRDPRKQPGVSAGRLEPTPDVKDSLDLVITRHADWEHVYSVLFLKLREGLEKYRKFFHELTGLNNIIIFDDSVCRNIDDCVFQVQKSGHFQWHEDFAIDLKTNKYRVLTYMWYLNTTDNDGATNFCFKKIKPETGKFVMFPASWTAIHKGELSKFKYIVTGWLWADIPK